MELSDRDYITMITMICYDNGYSVEIDMCEMLISVTTPERFYLCKFKNEDDHLNNNLYVSKKELYNKIK